MKRGAIMAALSTCTRSLCAKKASGSSNSGCCSPMHATGHGAASRSIAAITNSNQSMLAAPMLLQQKHIPGSFAGYVSHAGFFSGHNSRNRTKNRALPEDFYANAVKADYNAVENAAYWETRPVPVIARLATIGIELGKWKLNSYVRNDIAGDAARLREALVRLGPAFVKIGQALSSRPDVLPPDFLRELEKLQDRIPSFPSSEAFEVIEEELGAPISRIFSYISQEPVAAASLGQVYKATLAATGEQVAVKVQRPGVVEMIAMDVYVLRTLAGFVREWQKLNSDLAALVDEWATSLFRELDYTQEAANAVKFKELFSHMPEVYVPAIYQEYTTTRVLTMEWVDGERLRTASSKDLPSASARGNKEDLALVDVGVRCSLEQMLEEGFYHADPHPGNLLKMYDGRLCYLDFGMMGSIELPIRQALLKATMHLVNREYARLAEDFVSLGLLPPGSDKDKIVPALTGVFQQALNRGVSNLSFSDLSTDLGRTMYQFRFRIPAYYTLLVRSLTVLEGIALASDPNYKVLGAAYPWVARRLLTDQTPELRSTLRSLLYDDNGRFRFSRLESLLQQAGKARQSTRKLRLTAGGAKTAGSSAYPSNSRARAGPAVAVVAGPAGSPLQYPNVPAAISVSSADVSNQGVNARYGNGATAVSSGRSGRYGSRASRAGSSIGSSSIGSSSMHNLDGPTSRPSVDQGGLGNSAGIGNLNTSGGAYNPPGSASTRGGYGYGPGPGYGRGWVGGTANTASGYGFGGNNELTETAGVVTERSKGHSKAREGDRVADAEGGGGSAPLLLLLSEEGSYVRDILLDELAKGIDAAWRLAFDAGVDNARERALNLRPWTNLPLLGLLLPLLPLPTGLSNLGSTLWSSPGHDGSSSSGSSSSSSSRAAAGPMGSMYGRQMTGSSRVATYPPVVSTTTGSSGSSSSSSGGSSNGNGATIGNKFPSVRSEVEVTGMANKAPAGASTSPSPFSTTAAAQTRIARPPPGPSSSPFGSGSSVTTSTAPTTPTVTGSYPITSSSSFGRSNPPIIPPGSANPTLGVPVNPSVKPVSTTELPPASPYGIERHTVPIGNAPSDGYASSSSYAYRGNAAGGAAGRQAPGGLFQSGGSSSIEQLLSAMPRLSSAEDKEQVEGLLLLANAMANIAGDTGNLRTESSTTPPPRPSAGSTFPSSTDPKTSPSYPTGTMSKHASLEQSARFLNWLVKEVQSLPPQARDEALRLPVQLALRVSSRVVARAIRAVVTGSANTQRVDERTVIAEVTQTKLPENAYGTLSVLDSNRNRTSSPAVAAGLAGPALAAQQRAQLSRQPVTGPASLR